MQEIERLNLTLEDIHAKLLVAQSEKHKLMAEVQDGQFELQEENNNLKCRCEELQRKLEAISEIILTK